MTYKKSNTNDQYFVAITGYRDPVPKFISSSKCRYWVPFSSKNSIKYNQFLVCICTVSGNILNDLRFYKVHHSISWGITVQCPLMHRLLSSQAVLLTRHHLHSITFSCTYSVKWNLKPGPVLQCCWVSSSTCATGYPVPKMGEGSFTLYTYRYGQVRIRTTHVPVVMKLTESNNDVQFTLRKDLHVSVNAVTAFNELDYSRHTYLHRRS